METYLAHNDLVEQRPLISVCCICNRMRIEDDTWVPFDTSSDNLDFDMTHGFCPDCIRVHYPEAAAKMEEALAA